MHVRWLVSACSIGASGPPGTTTSTTASGITASGAAASSSSTTTATTTTATTLTVGPSTDEGWAGRGKHWRRRDRSNLGHRYRWFRQLRQHYVIG
uniref:Putative secreted protein n=1 Tax=Anopheles triannulatus TaxID=58253 RepID=A0A2M4B4G3_9DIPT